MEFPSHRSRRSSPTDTSRPPAKVNAPTLTLPTKDTLRHALACPFRILVSPFVHFDPETRTTDIMMFNSRNLGASIVDEDPHVKSWEDGQYNIQHMSIEETRSLHPVEANAPRAGAKPAED